MATKEQKTATGLGFTEGTKAHIAAAMYLKPKGATDAAIREACGGPQRNLLKRMEKQGHTVTRTKVKGPKGRMVTAYRINIKK